MEQIEKELKNKDVESLYRAVLGLKNSRECSLFFRDVMTYEEIVEITRRFEVARLLSKKASFRVIEKKTGMSSATIARVNYWLNHGTGGYRIALQRLKNKV